MVRIFISVARIALAVIVTVILSSCRTDIRGITGSGHVTTQTRNIQGDFHSIDAEGGLDIVIEQSDERSVTVKADDNLHKHIETTVDNGVLHIRTDKNQFVNVSAKEIIVKMPKIRSIEAGSGVTVRSANLINTNKLELDSSSGSSIKIDVEADVVISETSSGSHNTLTGKALNLDISSSSGSQNDASRLVANDVHAQASSGSSIRVNPILSLDSEASSGASIQYRKTPNRLIKDTSSGGSVSEF